LFNSGYQLTVEVPDFLKGTCDPPDLIKQLIGMALHPVGYLADLVAELRSVLGALVHLPLQYVDSRLQRCG
jgi:hypothetical protein